MTIQATATLRPTDFWSRVDKSGDCWIWLGAMKGNGYGQVGRNDFAHRRAYELANGPIPDGLHVMHSCDNPPCVRPEHLSLGTMSDNISDSYRKGRLPLPGGAVSQLTDEIVLRLRADYRGNPRPFGRVAQDTGLPVSVVRNAIRGRTFAHLGGAVSPSGEGACEARTGFQRSDFGFQNLYCRQVVGVTSFIDAQGRTRHHCSMDGHKAAVVARYGEGPTPRCHFCQRAEPIAAGTYTRIDFAGAIGIRLVCDDCSEKAS